MTDDHVVAILAAWYRLQQTRAAYEEARAAYEREEAGCGGHHGPWGYPPGPAYFEGWDYERRRRNSRILC